MTYEEKLVQLGIMYLKARRTRIDLVQTFKMLKGIDRVDFSTWFSTVGHEVTRVTRHIIPWEPITDKVIDRNEDKFFLLTEW